MGQNPWYPVKMKVELSERALAVEAGLDDGNYGRLWDVIERIIDDPEYARHAPWAQFVSSRKIWGTKIPGTEYTMFWGTEGDTLIVHLIEADLGL